MEDESGEDCFGVGKENDEQVMLQNRLRRRGHYTVQRSRPISYPPCFSLGAFKSPLYMKGSLMDRKPQKLIEPICEELSARIGRKVKFADEAGKQLVSYIEIPSKFDRFGFRSLTNITSIFEEVMGKDLNEIEQVFDSAFSAPHVREETRSEYKENTDSSLGCKRKYNTQSHTSFPKEKFPRAQSVVVHHPKETEVVTMSASTVDQRNAYSPQQTIKLRKHSFEGWAISETDEEDKSCSCDRVVESPEVDSSTTADINKGPQGQQMTHFNVDQNATQSNISLCDISTRSWQPGDYWNHRSNCNRDNLRYKAFKNIPCDRISSEEVPLLQRRTCDNFGSCRKTGNSVTITKPNEQVFEELIKKLHSAGQGSDSSGENNDHTLVSCPLSVNNTPIPVYHSEGDNVVEVVNDKEEPAENSILTNCPRIEVTSEKLPCRMAHEEPLRHKTSDCETFRKSNANEELSFTVVLDRQPDTAATSECSSHTGVTVDYTLPFESSRQNNPENKEGNVMTSSFDDNPNISFTIISPTPSCSDVTAASKENEALNITTEKLHIEAQQRDSPNLEAPQERNFITETNAAIIDILSVFDEVSFPEFTQTSLYTDDLEQEREHGDNISSIMLTPVNNLQSGEISDIHNIPGMLGVNRESESGYGTHSFISDDIFNEDTLSVGTSGFDLDDVFEEDTSDEVPVDSNSTLLQESINSDYDIKSDRKVCNSEEGNSLNTGDVTQATLTPPVGGNDNGKNQTVIDTDIITASVDTISDSEDCVLDQNHKQDVGNNLEHGDFGYQYIQDCRPTENVFAAGEVNYSDASIVNENCCDITDSHTNGLNKYTDKEIGDISLKQSLSESCSSFEHLADGNLHGSFSSCSYDCGQLDGHLNTQGNVKFSQNCDECQLNEHFRPEQHTSDSETNNVPMQDDRNSCDSYVSLVKNGTKLVRNNSSYSENSSSNVQSASVINSPGDAKVELPFDTHVPSENMEMFGEANTLATKADTYRYLVDKNRSSQVELKGVGASCADQGPADSSCASLHDENLDTSANDNSSPVQCYNMLVPPEQQSLSGSDAALELDCNSNGLMEKPESFTSTLLVPQGQFLQTQHDSLELPDDVVESSDMEVYMPKNMAKTLVDCIFRKKYYQESSDSESSENSANTSKHKIPERRARREANLTQRSKRSDQPLHKRPLFIPHVIDNDPNSGSESDIESFTSEESQGGSDVAPPLQLFSPDIGRISPLNSHPAVKLHFAIDKQFECSDSTSNSSAVSGGTEMSDKRDPKDVTLAGHGTDKGTFAKCHRVGCSSDSVDQSSSQDSVAFAESPLEKEGSVSRVSVSTFTSDTHPVELQSSLHTDTCKQDMPSAGECMNHSDHQGLFTKSHSDGSYHEGICLPLHNNSEKNSSGECRNSSFCVAKSSQSNVTDSDMIQHNADDQNIGDPVPTEIENSIEDNNDITGKDYSGTSSTGRSSCDESCLTHNICDQNIKVNGESHTMTLSEEANTSEDETMEFKEGRSNAQSSNDCPASTSDHNFNITVIITSEGRLIVQNDES